MTNVERIQRWYASQCDGDWEHQSGVEIGTLDNPGWHLKINRDGTDLEEACFETVEYGDPDDTRDWIRCHAVDGKFVAYGGPLKLDEMLCRFLDWVEQGAPPSTS